MALSLGFTLGSILGGLLSRYGVGASLLGGGAMALVNVCAAAALPMPPLVRPPTDATRTAKASTATAEPQTAADGAVVSYRSLCADVELQRLLGCKALIGLAFFVMTGTFDLFCRERFGVSAGLSSSIFRPGIISEHL
eukprot:SAG11_NODE_2790_length_2969_cov_1.817073_1_plen_138_part_00